MSFPLVQPYKLSFGAINAYETVYVKVVGEDDFGVGEITPLPGYSSEDLHAVKHALEVFMGYMSQGKDVSTTLQELYDNYPMTVSGIHCAFETLKEGYERSYATEVPTPCPITTLCQADTPAEIATEAKRLVENGSTSLKLKAGFEPVDHTAEKCLAVLNAVEDKGVEVRIDANGGFTDQEALAFCKRVEGAGLAWLEQPFRENPWEMTTWLSQHTDTPIYLDECIFTLQDVDKAAAAGAKGIKFKLCKCQGLKGVRESVAYARSLGLNVIFGNGVQTAVGNHLEIRLNHELQLGLACECNGFLKPANHIFPHGLTKQQAYVQSQGLNDAMDFFKTTPSMAEVTISPQQFELFEETL